MGKSVPQHWQQPLRLALRHIKKKKRKARGREKSGNWKLKQQQYL